MGGTVEPAEQSEVGVHEIAATPAGARHAIFDGLEGTQPVMQWHHAEVKRLPAGAVVLAASAATRVQAIAIADIALGLQFHAEWTPQTLASWHSQPATIAALERQLGPGAYDRLIAQASPLMPRMGAMTRRLYANLMRVSGLKRAA
jgi:GMP synthase-like glutamine amidotransferase